MVEREWLCKMETPATYDIVIRKGNDFSEVFEFQNDDLTPMNLTGWTVLSQLRKGKKRESELIVDFTIDIPDPSNGKVYQTLTDAQTDALVVGIAYFDMLFISPSGYDETYVEGSATINPSITKKE